MAKISREEAEKRRKFALEQWQKDPFISVPKMNDLIKQYFDGRMNTQHLYKIKDEVQRALGIDHESIKRRAKDAALRGYVTAYRSDGVTDDRPIIVPIKSEQERELLKTLFAELSARKWCNTVVEFTSHYALISVSLPVSTL